MPAAAAMRSRRGPGALVGLGGLEPPTSRLSGVRSNQLSYRPTPRGDAGEIEPVETVVAPTALPRPGPLNGARAWPNPGKTMVPGRQAGRAHGHPRAPERER